MFDFGQANEEQKKAIQHVNGPALIIAGPGTGKTFTLVKRVIYLIVEKGIAPENILIATFTEKAAKELISRISNELIRLSINVNVNDLYIGTIHSICLRLIKENVEYTRLKKNYRLLDEFDQKYLVYRNFNSRFLITNLQLNATRLWDKAKELTYYLNVMSEELIAARILNKYPPIDWRNSNFILPKDNDVYMFEPLANAYRAYQKLLEEENALDFSSIQVTAYELLKNNQVVREKVQKQIQYVMIDEYQDTNYVQEQLIFLIAEKHHNICVVGDDDQGLYRFRGATIRNILEFPDKWPSCARFTLVENYRSEKGIVNFYNNWMQETELGGFEWKNFRYAKNIKASKSNQLQNVPTVLKIAGESDLQNWGDSIIDFIETLKSSKAITDYNQIAFLFRSVKNEKVISLAQYLERQGIPVYSPRSDMFFQREEIKLLIGALLVAFPTYLKKMQEPDNHIPKAIMNYYLFYCLPTFQEFQMNNPNAQLIKWCAQKGLEHSNPNNSFDYAFTGLVYEMLQFEPFFSIMQSEISGVADSRAIRNIAEFTKLTTRFEFLQKITIFTPAILENALKHFFNYYLLFLYEGGIGEYEDDSEYAPSGCVSFMTIHQSKGMEFPVVIVGSLFAIPRNDFKEIIQEMEANFYEKKPFEPNDYIKYFDFWRVFYTAFSRAQNLLVLTANENGKKEPSKYFKPIYDELPYYWDNDIDYSKIKCEPVKNVNIKQSYSFTSHISLYENCSLQYKFFKDLGFIPVREGATIFGQLVHATIEDIHKAALRGESEIINNENIEKWFFENYETILTREHTYLSDNVRQAALNQVLRYANKPSSHWDKIKDAEVEVSHVEEDYILTGKVDLIEGENGTLEIVDFKAEKKPDMALDKERIERYKRQLQIYAYIIEQKTGLSVSKLRLYYTGDDTSGIPEITFPNDKAKVQETKDEFTRIVHKIQCRDYSTRSTSQKLCNNCDLRHFCKRN